MNTMLRYLAMVVGMTSLVSIAPFSDQVYSSPLGQDDVVPLLEQGEIIPIKQILKKHSNRLQGRLIDLELEHEHGRLVYELEILDKRGIVREYLIDAYTNEWLGED